MSVVLKNFTQLGCLQPPCLFYREGFDTSFGTLWWIAEALWREKGVRRTKKESHPGLSVSLDDQIQLQRSYAQMLHGTSDPRKGYPVIKGMTRKEPERLTYFGKLTPVPVKIEDAEFTPETTEFAWNDKGWTDKTRIIWNRDKPRITDEEYRQLKDWIESNRNRQHWNKGGSNG